MKGGVEMFGGKKKTEEELSKEVYEKFGLDIDSYNNEDIKRENSKNLKEIGLDLAGKKWIRAGLALSFSRPVDQATLGYLNAIFNSNLILIRQNELIIRLLEKGK